jgi:hypothetical protein
MVLALFETLELKSSSSSVLRRLLALLVSSALSFFSRSVCSSASTMRNHSIGGEWSRLFSW